MPHKDTPDLTLEKINEQIAELKRLKLDMAAKEIQAICQKYGVELAAAPQLKVMP